MNLSTAAFALFRLDAKTRPRVFEHRTPFVRVLKIAAHDDVLGEGSPGDRGTPSLSALGKVAECFVDLLSIR